MPLSVRARIAITFGAIISVLMLIFAVILQGVGTSREIHRAEEATRELAVRLGRRIVTASALGDTLLTVADITRDPPVVRATPWLAALMEGVPHYVYVLAPNGGALLTSYEVREMDPAQRRTLDSVAARVTPGQIIRVDAERNVVATDPFFARVTSVPLRNGRLIVYAVQLSFPAADPRDARLLPAPRQWIERVVVAEVAALTPLGLGDVVGPLLVLGPLIAVAVMAGAHYAAKLAYQPITQLIADASAVTDGRSLHRRLAIDDSADEQLVRLTDTLNAMIGRLETSFASLRRFTADASHELKTPLTVLRADVERAMSPRTPAAERAEALEEALAETTRMASLVESLLTLARADEGRFDLHREPVDLGALARDVYETALLLGEPRNVKVNLDALPELTVLGDRARLRQLWLNLIENGIKYTPDGGTVNIRLARDNGTARFEVRDSGIGIAAADLPHIFDRFWRADRARSRASERGGFGLGLAISQYIAQAHGGSLTAHSRLGRGSTFVVELPVAPSESDENGAGAAFINS